MTDYALTPGCFGSAVLYRRTASECSACSEREECAKTAAERFEQVFSRVTKLDLRFEQERAKTFARTFAARFKRDKVADRKRAQALSTLDTFKRASVNVYEIKHRMNPIPKDSPIIRTVVQLVIDNGLGFTRRDIADELYAAHSDVLTRASAKSTSEKVCDALLEAGVLRAEKRGILCLNS